jgi:hypothetical protein
MNYHFVIQFEKAMLLMNALLIVFAGAVFSCSRPQPVSEPYPNHLIKDEDWIVYEGTLPSSYGFDVHVELSLFPGSPGLDARYQMIEYRKTASPAEYNGWIQSRGRYILLSSPEAQIIHITDRSFVKALYMRGEFSMPEIGKENLYLKGDGEHQLILLDDKFKKWSDNYILTRRTSPLFTVEGYFSVYNDTTDFFERNTGTEWAVAELAEYEEAVKNYSYLFKEKFEGVYLKALAYTVHHRSKGGKEIDALVFKKILHMDSTARIR